MRQETTSPFPPDISYLVSCKSSRFHGFCAGPRSFRRSQVSRRRAKGAPGSLLVRFGGRCGNFQLKATIYCSKSRVINCIVRESVGYPATARGSGRSVGATTGGLMQCREGVCVSILIRMGSRLPSAALRSLTTVIMLCLLILGWAATASAQVNTATLSGTVSDLQGLPVKGAQVTLTNASTGAQRTSVTDDGGRYNVVGLPPGQYKMTVDGGANFGLYQGTFLVLTVGEDAGLNLHLELRGIHDVITVSTEATPVETAKSEVSQTVGQRRIENLPINGRSYINFTLTDSQFARDNAPPTGAAPTSGLNSNGQRARSNLVNVDGGDATDNAVNGVRSTVSQEAVQEFQIITNSYAAEYGRASGGVVNIITRSGSNEFHGDVFGYLRNRYIQATNPFSNVSQPPYTRVQAGTAFGGPIKKDKTYYYFAYEVTRRHETGFASIGQDIFGLVLFDATNIFAPGQAPAGTFNIQVTPQQAAFLSTPLPPPLQGLLQ